MAATKTTSKKGTTPKTKTEKVSESKTTKTAKTKTEKVSETKAEKATTRRIKKDLSKSLVIVESPAKAKTIQKYLGAGFEVVASNGHIRDLPKSKFGIDVDNNFAVDYVDMKGKEEVVRKLKDMAAAVGTVYLATDPDREGEAISWHLAQILGLDLNATNRVEFNEITKTGVQNGMANPHKIDINLVNAQQARRVLDRIVGYKISPFLWRKVRRGLSAGRVQSVAVMLVVIRDREISAFVAEEYWSIDTKMTNPPSRKIFDASLSKINGKKAQITSKEQADEILDNLKDAKYIATNVKKGVAKKNPVPPFITSTLQQEASRRIGFQAARTMKTAQQLYEGVDIQGIGTIGLITYMRTDSLRISNEAQNAALDYIEKTYGKQYLPESPRFYKSKKNSQDAHEAIRPSTPSITPAQVKDSLTPDQYKIYKLIWERFIASQMASAIHDTMSVEITANQYTFKATGYAVKFDGFTVLYEEQKDSKDPENNKMLPEIKEGDELSLREISGNQHFTQPPARYTEATLIKALEENGIGRPSTYAPTISTITSRFYVERDGKQLKSTALGETVTNLLTDNFNLIVDTGFTSNMEEDLDIVEKGEKDWTVTVKEFYDSLMKIIETADAQLEGKRYKVPTEVTGEKCELCGADMVIRTGKFGKFIGCANFPECSNTKKIIEATKGTCPKCGGVVAVKKSKKGRNFFGCVNFPNCEFATPYTPVEDKCPKCGASLFKKGGRNGKLLCLKEGCGFERDNK